MGVAARLRARWYLVVIAVIVAVLVSGASLYHIGPHGLKQKKSVYHTATAQLLVDTDPSTLTTVSGASAGLATRAPYIAEYATSPSVTAAIQRAVGHPIKVETAVKSAAAPGVASPGTAVSTGSGSDSVVLQATNSSPAIQISAQAGSLQTARKIAVATVRSLRASLVGLQKAEAAAMKKAKSSASSGTATSAGSPTPPPAGASSPSVKIVLRTLGSINATNVVSTPKKSKAILYGVAAFIILLLVILALDNVLRGGRRGARRQPAVRSSPE